MAWRPRGDASRHDSFHDVLHLGRANIPFQLSRLLRRDLRDDHFAWFVHVRHPHTLREDLPTIAALAYPDCSSYLDRRSLASVSRDAEHVVGGIGGQAPLFASLFESCAAVPPHLTFSK